MGVKGVLPLYSSTMIPLSRREVADDLIRVEQRKEQLTDAERQYLERFEQEFMHEIDPSRENVTSLFNGGSVADILSEKEKYLYRYSDSTLSNFIELLGTAEYRAINGESFGSTHASFEQHGGRIRGTIKDKVGYYLQGTDGTLYGNREFALSDPKLRGNVKFNELNSPYFDFTEAYVRADFDWFDVEFGREFNRIGTGYSDRLILSDNAPVLDFLKLGVHYKSVRFEFLQAQLVGDAPVFPGGVNTEPQGVNKYLALHRLQFSLFDRLNFGVSEMMIYRRFSPDFAYLNPIDFYKSASHALRDRDNAFLVFDLETFPLAGYKLYGTWLIDDIDFSKLGTGWWGNEFAWQGGLYAADVAGIGNLDAVVEYTRIEPYVYSNYRANTDYSHNNFGLGHHLEPNSDEWFLQVGYRPCKKLRAWLGYTVARHGENVVSDTGLVRNVGGDLLVGHRNGIDSDVAEFLDGNLVRNGTVQVRAIYELVRNLYITGIYEYRITKTYNEGLTLNDRYASVQVRMEY